MKYKVTNTKIGHADKTCQIAHDGILYDFHEIIEIIVKVYVYSQNDSE